MLAGRNVPDGEHPARDCHRYRAAKRRCDLYRCRTTLFAAHTATLTSVKRLSTDTGARGEEIRTTEYDGITATWFARDGVIRVVGVRDTDGAETLFDGAPSLGECFDRMPRRLWDRVRFQHRDERMSEGARSPN